MADDPTSRRVFLGSLAGLCGGALLWGGIRRGGADWPAAVQKIDGRSHGLVGDGRTDEQPQLQRILDEAPPGSVVAIAPGAYALGRRVLWPTEKPLTLECETGSKFTQRNGTNDYLFAFPAGAREARIAGATFAGTGNRKQAVVVYSANAGAKPARDLLFDRIQVSTWDGEVFLLAANGASGDSGSVPQRITIRDCMMDDLGEAALAVFAGADIRFEGNHCVIGHRTEGSGGNAVIHPMHFSYDLSAQPDALLVARRIRITGNTFVCNAPEFGGHAVSLDNNTRLFKPDSVGDFLIAGNLMTGSFQFGVRAVFSDDLERGLTDAVRLQIEDNRISDVERSGVSILGGHGHTVIDNEIVEFGQDGQGDHGGIRVQHVTGAVISGNLLESARDCKGVIDIRSPTDRVGSDNVVENNRMTLKAPTGCLHRGV